MTLLDIEELAHWIAPDDIHPQSAGEDDVRLARAVLALLPVVRAVEAWNAITPYSEQGHRDKYAAYVALANAIDTMRAALGGGE